MRAQARQRKGKKGQWTPTIAIATVIIMIIVLSIMIFVYTQIWESSGIDKEACRQSVQLNGRTKHKILTGLDMTKHIVDPYGNAVELQCETEFLKIHDEEPEVLKKKVADSMVDCWQMYGEGELEIFDTNDGNYCAICSRLEFDEQTILPDFTDYLMDNNPPRNELTYFEYFKQTGKRCGGKILPEKDTPDIIEESDISLVDNIDTSEPLAVMFVLGKNAYPNGVFPYDELDGAVTGAAIGSSIGLVAGSAAGIIVGLALCSTGAGCALGAPMLYVAITAGVATAVGSAASGAVTYGAMGYALGSSCTANYDAYIMLWNYSDIGSLDCTQLEGKGTNLEVKDI